MRTAIVDYFDSHQGTIMYQGANFPPDADIRNTGYGGLTEIMAFAAMFHLSVEVHFPETHPFVQHISYRPPGDAPDELLLQTLGWNDSGSRAVAGDHWQRLRKKAAPPPPPPPPPELSEEDRKVDQHYFVPSQHL